MQFTYYLHDDYNTGEMRDYLEEQGVELSEEAWENVGRPFYEVTLVCDVDETGKVTLIEAKL